jgi:hypothetical protein
MEYIKSFNQLYEKLTDIEYHFTSINGIYQILKSNKFNLTPVFGTRADSEINKNKAYFMSLTSSRSSDLGFAASKGKNSLVRLKMDGRKLNHNFKSTRVDYWQRPKDPKHPTYNPHGNLYGRDFYKQISRQDELEDRIISDDNEILDGKRFIISIDILCEPKDINNEKYGILKKLSDDLNIPFYLYDEQKYFDAEIKEKALKVEPIEGEIEIYKESGSKWAIAQLVYLMIFKDDGNKEIIYNKLKEMDFDTDSIKEDVEKGLEKYRYYLNTDDEFRISDFRASVENTIHNHKTTTNETLRYLIKQLSIDMKKHNCRNIKEYLKYKVWIGKKRQQDFNIEFNDNLMKLIDASYKKEFDNLAMVGYDKDEDRHDNIFAYEPVKKFIDKQINRIKKHCSDYILKNDDLYDYRYLMSKSHLIEDLNIKEISYEPVLHELSNNEYYSYDKNIERLLYYVLDDIDNYCYTETNRIREEYSKQWDRS